VEDKRACPAADRKPEPSPAPVVDLVPCESAPDKPLSMAAAPFRIRNMESGIGPPTIADVNVMTKKTNRYAHIPYGKIWSVMETLVNGNRIAMTGSTV
jgi:hypothetical protein